MVTLPPMPTRLTKRGSDRTPLSGAYDVIICGASFAGLAVARQLAGADARVIVLDRYEIGERQTSACGIPTDWLRVMGLDPVEFTLTPKYLGALITVPCLTVLSTFCGVFAGYLFLAFSADMNIRVYFHAVVESILLRDVCLTLIKSVIFATIIVQVGYLEGLRARGGPEAVGGAATAAVVKATFLVILADLGATTVFYVMGWSAVG